jgi:GNAT superfamily N-acetyltransferase
LRIRDVTERDLPFLTKMWLTAAFWQPEVFVMSETEAFAVPEIARYIEGWGRDGDVGVIVEREGTLVGAAWYRTFSGAEPGYGYVDDATPELAIAVEDVARRSGVGAALLDALIDRARSAGHSALSLSVNDANPSRRLYLSRGFVDVSHDDGSFVMVLRF